MEKVPLKDRAKKWMDSARRVSVVAQGAAIMSASQLAVAAGVDTGSSSMNGAKTWLMTWIPIAATIAIIVVALGWMFHMVNLTVAGRLGVGLMVIGSASYLVGLFGLSA